MSTALLRPSEKARLPETPGHDSSRKEASNMTPQLLSHSYRHCGRRLTPAPRAIYAAKESNECNYRERLGSAALGTRKELE